MRSSGFWCRTIRSIAPSRTLGFSHVSAAVETFRPEILVEGEIGDIGSGSEIHDTARDLRKGLTTPAEARQFVEETRIDTLAPAVGNMHGNAQ